MAFFGTQLTDHARLEGSALLSAGATSAIASSRVAVSAATIAATTTTVLSLLTAVAVPLGCSIGRGLNFSIAQIDALFVADQLSEQITRRDRLNPRCHCGDHRIKGSSSPVRM